MLKLKLFTDETPLKCLSRLLVALIDCGVAIWLIAKEPVSEHIIVFRAVNKIDRGFNTPMLNRDQGVFGYKNVDTDVVHKLVLHQAVLEHDLLVEVVHVIVAFVLEDDAPGPCIWHDLVFKEFGEADPGSLVGAIAVGVHIIAIFIDQQRRDIN